MHQYINADWVQKYSWRSGVFLMLTVVGFIAVAVAQRVLEGLTPEASNFLATTMEVGMYLMLFSFVLGAVKWGYRKYRGD